MVSSSDITKAIISAADMSAGNLDFEVDVSTWGSNDITTMIDEIIDDSASKSWKLKGVRVSGDVFLNCWSGNQDFQNAAVQNGVAVVIGITDFGKVELVFKP